MNETPEAIAKIVAEALERHLAPLREQLNSLSVSVRDSLSSIGERFRALAADGNEVVTFAFNEIRQSEAAKRGMPLWRVHYSISVPKYKFTTGETSTERHAETWYSDVHAPNLIDAMRVIQDSLHLDDDAVIAWFGVEWRGIPIPAAAVN